MHPVPQTDPPLPPWQTLPTMYDLPSEDPEEPGLPDEFHNLQPQLLSRTLRLACVAEDEFFTGSDMNLYYDKVHTQWYKRPDWFLSIGVPRLYEGREMRNSYVIWQERVAPFVIVELLSPGTEAEDLGPFAPNPINPAHADQKIPGKWQVYEQILRVPYYVVFSRYTNELRFFHLVGGHYQEQPLNATNPRLWISELDLGLGLWEEGTFDGVTRSWIRWCDAAGNWLLTDAEAERAQKEQERAQKEQERAQKEQERAQKEQERAQKEQALLRAEQAEAQVVQVARNLLQTGMSIAQVSSLTGLSEAQLLDLR
jgi:Uma2 family endonuclease